MSGFFDAGCTVTSKIPDIRRKLGESITMITLDSQGYVRLRLTADYAVARE
jgi:hypothetical protein